MKAKKKLISILLTVSMMLTMFPFAAFADDANDAGSVAESAEIVLPEGRTADSFKDGNTVYYDGQYYKTLVEALKAAAGVEGAVLYCKPGAHVGDMTHGHVCASMTVYGNDAWVDGGENEFEVDTYYQSNPAGNGGHEGCPGLKGDLTLTINNLNNSGVWGQRTSNHTINVVMNNCKNAERVYLTGTTGVNNITINGNTYTGNLEDTNKNVKGGCAIYSNALGTIKIENCEFDSVPVPINLNNKSNGAQTITVANTVLNNCATIANTTADQQKYASGIRVLSTAEGGSSVVNVNNCTFTYDEGAVKANGDILLGDGRVDGKTSNDAVTLNIVNTAADVQMQKPGYYTADGSTDASKLQTATVKKSATASAFSIAEAFKVAQIGENFYSSLAEAIAQNDSGTITLMANVTENVTIPQGKNLTLDLNGKTLTSAVNNNHTVIIDGGTLNVTDSTVGQPVVGDDHENVIYKGSGIIQTSETTVVMGNKIYPRAIIAKNGGILNLQGGTVYSNDSDAIYIEGGAVMNMTGGYINSKEYGIGVKENGTTLNFSGGVVRARNNAAIAGNGSTGLGGTVINMTGGTVIGEMTVNAVQNGSIACGIYHPQEGTLTVNGGNIYVHNGAGIVARSGAATINNVNIVTTGNTKGKVGDSRVVVPCSAVVVDEDANYPGGGLDTDIKGGNFVSAEGVSNVTLVGQTNDKLTVSGGSFSAPVPQKYLDSKLNTEVKAPNKNPDAPYSYFEKQEEALEYAKDDKDATVQPTKPVADSVTLTFNLNEGQGAPASVTVAKDGTVVLPTPSRDGYRFDGWAAQNGQVYAGGSSLKVESDMVLTALWSIPSTPSKPSYDVTLADTDNGSITATHKRASKNSTVSITATPDEGYVVDAVTVTEKDGDKVEVTKKDNNKYTFKMPASDVTVKATFKVAPTEPEQPSGLPFTDVAKDAWYFPAVEYVYNNELMNGTNGGLTFEPNVNLNRAMMAAVLYNMEGGPACDKSGLFSDVADGKWYTDAVNWAASNNIVSGMPDGTYAPDQALTREQMASILYRYAEYKGIDVSARADLSTFTDGTTVSPWAQDVVQWAVAEKLMSGNGNELQPKGTATRAQVATVLMNYCENVAK